MKPFSNFERYMLAQPVAELRLPRLDWIAASEADIAERAFILGYGEHISRGEENLRLLAIAVAILPGSPEEISELEHAGF